MHEETQKAHGRIDHRKIELAQVGHVRWPGLKQWGRITRTRTKLTTGEVEREEVYIISSLGGTQANAAELLSHNRSQWRIENQLHRTKDTLLREDASTLRTGSSPQVAAALCNTALRYLAKLHPSPIQAREIETNNINKAIQLLTSISK